ncbi:MAG: NACHT domain-containing protein, partial [Fidelibacterota bacterium]
MKGKNRGAVRELLDISERLFGEDNIFPVNGGAVLQRTIQTQSKTNAQQDFSEWFYANIISNMLVDDDSIGKRVFILSGRAGQGKSTMLRHIFLHLKNQETKDARLRPNFTREIDEKLGKFFSEYQDQVHYYQAREMPESSFSVGKHKQLVLIDGLDEASDNQIGIISETIVGNPKSLFLLSSRSKSDPEPGNPAHQEVINENVLSKYLQKKGERFNLQKSCAFLSPMTLREKKSMMTLIEEHDEGTKYDYLSTLVENDSQIIQRPAD